MPHRALVIGSSFSGLWAARVLSDFFERVTVFERDRLPDGPASRPGVPQDRHVHVLLQRGAHIMSGLFPGIENELTSAGAHRLDLMRDGKAKLRGRWLPRFESGKVTFACSRILLESVVRRRVETLPNVDFCDGARVGGPVTSAGRVTGVRVYWKDRDETTTESGDFIVDASGRSSRTPEWLAELGYGDVKESVIDVRMGYAGRRYRAPTDPAPGWSTMLVGQEPPHRSRGGLIYPEENGVWMVMMGGILGDYPPTDPDGFLDFAAGIDPEFQATIRAAEPISNVISYRRTENRFRHFEKLARWPDRYIAVGDAVCGFNPIYGQGMTVGAMAAEALGKALAGAKGSLDGVAQQFQRSYPRVVAPAWLLATSADLEWLGGKKAPTPAERFASWYFPKMLDVVPEDQVVLDAFLDVQHLMQPVTALFHPRIATRVFWRRLKNGRQAAPVGQE